MVMTDIFVRDFPLERTHSGIPLANGNMGVLVWGKSDRLCVTVNRADLWDHRFGEQVLPGPSYQQLIDAFDPQDIRPTNEMFVRCRFPLDREGFWWRPTRLPVGRFEFILNDVLAHASLDYLSGVLEVVTQSGHRLQLMISRNEPQLLVRDVDRLIRQVKARPAWEWIGPILESAGFAPPVHCRNGSAIGWFQSCPADPGISARCVDRDGQRLICLTRESEPVWDIDQPADWDRTLTANRQWWRRYWSQCPSLTLPNEPWLQAFYRFALYKFACATDPNGVACGLQGPWVEEYQRTPWSGDYHFNVNIQQIYTLALSIGAYDHMLPLFDMLESEAFQKVMRQNARNLFGIDDGLLLTHAVDDRGMQCGGIAAGSVLDFACGGWVAQLYWLYYQHTQDIDFLRRRAMPFMRGIMRVYESSLREHEGKLSIPLSVSAEYGVCFPVMIDGKPRQQNAGRNSSNQLMCAHMLAEALLEACDVLGVEPRPIWQDIRDRLPQYVTTGQGEDQHISLWEGQDLDVCHRHHSHLALVYPFSIFDPSDPDQARIVNNTIDHWILRGMGQWSEWCYPWAAIIHARMGFTESPIHLMRLWRGLFLNEGWATVYLPQFRGLSAHRRADMAKPRQTSEIMQLDGTMAGATAIVEMLVHQQAGVIHLFRGIPQEWSEAAFERVRLPGGLTISASMRDGRLESITLIGPKPQIYLIAFRGHQTHCPCQVASSGHDVAVTAANLACRV